jgi:tetratricopeptide (TPR) repeat protein
MSSDDPAILDSMGWAYYRLGKYSKAIKFLRKALATLKDPEIAAHLGEVLWVSGDHEQARDVWNAARRDSPSHKMLLDVIKRFTDQ